MWHRSNHDWMLFLISPMAFTGLRTHDLFTKPNPLKSKVAFIPLLKKCLVSVNNTCLSTHL